MKKEELKNELRSAFQSLLKDIEGVSEKAFYEQNNGKWSIAQNMAHLTLSAKLFSRALKVPKPALVLKFGLNFNKQRTLDWMDQYYREAIIPSVTGFEPRMSPNSTFAFEKESFIARHEEIIDNLAAWREWQLNLLRLPQLVFGKLSVGEMLLFMGYHIKHHQKAIKACLNNINKNTPT